MWRCRACIWCKIPATAARENHFDTLKIENFGADMMYLIQYIHNILQYGFASFFASSSAGQIRTGSGECVAVQDVADVWGSPAVDLDRALTKAPETSRCMVGGADGTKAPDLHQLNLSQRSDTVRIWRKGP